MAAAARSKAGQQNTSGQTERMPRSVVANPAQPYDAGIGPQAGGSQPIPRVQQIGAQEPPLTIVGATGTSFFGGLIQNDEYNPELHWRDWVLKVETMVRNDAQIRALLGLVTDTLLAAKWSVEPASDDPLDVAVASFVQTCLFEDMRYQTDAGVTVQVPWSETLRHILLMLAYGFSPLEICYRTEGDWVKWARWLPLLPRTVWRWNVGEDNELDSITQWAYKDYAFRFANIPASKLLLFSWQREGQNYEGLSLLRPCFKYWWYKDQALSIAAIGIERNTIEPPVIKLGPNATSADANAALQIGQNIRANEALAAVIPHDWELAYPRMAFRGGENVLAFVQYCDVLMARAFYAQWINLGSTETGAYSLDASQKLTWLSALQAVATYVGDVVTHGAIKQLVDYNFPAGSLTAYPKLTCSKLIAQDLDTLASAIQSLNAYIPPSPDMADYVADLIGLPKPPRNLVEATNPTGGVGGGPGGPGGPGGGQQGGGTAFDKGTKQDGGQPSGDDGSDGGGGSDAGGDGGGQFAELRATAALLSEAARALLGADAVERGDVWLAGGYNPYRDRNGKFAPGPHAARESSGGEGEGGRGGRGEGEKASRGGGGGRSGGGSRGSRSGGKSAKGEKSAEPKAPKAPKSEAEKRQSAIERQRAKVETLRQESETTYAALEHAINHGSGSVLEDGHLTIRSAQAGYAYQKAAEKLAKMETAHATASKAEMEALHAQRTGGGAKGEGKGSAEAKASKGYEAWKATFEKGLADAQGSPDVHAQSRHIGQARMNNPKYFNRYMHEKGIAQEGEQIDRNFRAEAKAQREQDRAERAASKGKPKTNAIANYEDFKTAFYGGKIGDSFGVGAENPGHMERLIRENGGRKALMPPSSSRGGKSSESAPKAKASTAKAQREATKQEALHQAYRDWASGRAHLDRSGRYYRLYNVDENGHKTGGSKVAPWAKAVKATHPDVDSLDRAAREYAKAHPDEIKPIKRLSDGEGGVIDAFTLAERGA